MIQIEHLTKDYGAHRGVFDVSLKIEAGEVYGYLGPNGAGKSTTLRHIMGFGKPDAGKITINGLDAWRDSEKIKEFVGYLPGEISLPEDMKGIEYLKLIASMRKMKSFSYAKELLEYFEINANTGIKRMSKGMKQKVAIVSTFMHNPDIILLDEPTSGLDPLMQERFVELISKKKSEGKTILMSSHIFDEVSKVCDRVGILKEGSFVNEIEMDKLRNDSHKTFVFEVSTEDEKTRLSQIYSMASWKGLEAHIDVEDKDINSFIKNISGCTLLYLSEQKHSLEEYFMQYYGGERHV